MGNMVFWSLLWFALFIPLILSESGPQVGGQEYDYEEDDDDVHIEVVEEDDTPYEVEEEEANIPYQTEKQKPNKEDTESKTEIYEFNLEPDDVDTLIMDRRKYSNMKQVKQIFQSEFGLTQKEWRDVVERFDKNMDNRLSEEEIREAAKELANTRAHERVKTKKTKTKSKKAKKPTVGDGSWNGVYLISGLAGLYVIYVAWKHWEESVQREQVNLKRLRQARLIGLRQQEAASATEAGARNKPEGAPDLNQIKGPREVGWRGFAAAYCSFMRHLRLSLKKAIKSIRNQVVSRSRWLWIKWKEWWCSAASEGREHSICLPEESTDHGLW